MDRHPFIIAILLSLAVFFCALSCLGLVVMRDSFQRLHFSSFAAGVSSPFLAAAVWVQTNDFQARIKSLIVVGFLIAITGVLTHAMARAIRIRKRGRWELDNRFEEDRRIERVG